MSHVFSNLQLAHQTDLSGRRRLCYWNSGRAFWRRRKFHCRSGVAADGSGLELRGRHGPGAHRWQVDRRSKKTSHARQCRYETRYDHGAGHDRWRRRWRSTHSSPQARRQREHRRQLGRYCCLCRHFDLHALGEPQDTEVKQGPIAPNHVRCKGCGIKNRSFGIRTSYKKDPAIENLADDQSADLRNTNLFLDILVVAIIGGFFSGFLGGGAGYIRMPSMVYVLGVPTHLAVGTDLFEIIISASYGTFTHAMKGNVDILIALVMHTGAVVGAQIGVVATQYFAGPKIRLAFVPLPLIGAAIVIYTLLTGHKL